MTTNKKKKSAARKLVPAAGMLAVSAAMLASSTYAWFTMSREVEVTGIKMTAVVPEDLQISLGLGQNTGNKLTKAGTINAAIPWVDTVTAPANTVKSLDWSNTVAFSDFYYVGKLIPASSTTGEHIFYTPNAIKTGEDVAASSTFVQADAFTKDASNAVTGLGQAATVLKDDENYTFNIDDAQGGYYVDFPVWFRTSSETDITLVVDATIKDSKTMKEQPAGSGNYVEDDTTSQTLYRSARVAILDADDTVDTRAVANTTTAALGLTQGVIYNPYVAADVSQDTTLATDANVGATGVYPQAISPYIVSGKRTAYSATNWVLNNYNDAYRYYNRYSNTGDGYWFSTNNGASDTALKLAAPSTGLTSNIAVQAAGSLIDSTSGKVTSATLAAIYGYVDQLAQPEVDATSSVNYKLSTAEGKTNLIDADAVVFVPGSKSTVIKTDGTFTNGDVVPSSADTTTANRYGVAVKKIVRVWLEGEDINCWNANAGQDFEISLKFINQDSNAPSNIANGTTGKLNGMTAKSNG